MLKKTGTRDTRSAQKFKIDCFNKSDSSSSKCVWYTSFKENHMIQLQNKKCEFMKKTLQSDSVVLGVSNVDW